ncbi:MAG: hypothetical protein HC927_04790 [Deltaproteobacteria bacterium]|nr:hypothetical protein [Deltaproteobacteria bacterium]
MATYTFTGRVVSPNGTPIALADVEVFERASLTSDVRKALVQTDTAGSYVASWMQTATPPPWDLFVRATYSGESVDSALVSDPTEAPVHVDLVLGSGPYRGLTEWERITNSIQSLVVGTAIADIQPDRLEWLARRADVFPTHLAAYVQAYRLSDSRTVEATTCYACLRAGSLPNCRSS